MRPDNEAMSQFNGLRWCWFRHRALALARRCGLGGDRGRGDRTGCPIADQESIRELVARSDDEASCCSTSSTGRSGDPGGAKPNRMSGMVDEHGGAMRTTLGSLEDAYHALPATLRQVVTKLTEPDGLSQLAVIAELLAALLVAGLAIEWLYHRALRRFRMQLAQTSAQTY
jgi:hypothetical protein